jgi:hypothetical protein
MIAGLADLVRFDPWPMCFARGSRLFSPVRCWEEVPVFYISAWGHR